VLGAKAELRAHDERCAFGIDSRATRLLAKTPDLIGGANGEWLDIQVVVSTVSGGIDRVVEICPVVREGPIDIEAGALPIGYFPEIPRPSISGPSVPVEVSFVAVIELA
jgi:hypothetical protein